MLWVGTSWAHCSGMPQKHRQLQWSEATQTTSPNRRWEVVVQPALTSDNNQSSVLLRSCQGDGAWSLLTLVRSAEAFWAPGSQRLLIINQPTADGYDLLLFDVDDIAGGGVTRNTLDVDATVKEDVIKSLGKSRYIEFYLPKLVSWKDGSLVISVGGTTWSGHDGPMRSYCYGFVIDDSARRVRYLLSRKELKAKFGAECLEFP